jgi:hypothetical protein
MLMIKANAEVAATIARMKEYQESSAQFCKRILDYLEITFKYQVRRLSLELSFKTWGTAH